MDDGSIVTVNDRNYVDPNRQVQETDEFINNLRDIQNQNNTQITDQVRNLGADLVGSGGVWRSRYQTPQVNSMINNLRATTQAAALSQQLQNELNQKQREYKLAYRAAYNRAKAASNSNNNNNTSNQNKGNTNIESPGQNPQLDALQQREMWDKVQQAIDEEHKGRSAPGASMEIFQKDPISGQSIWKF